MMLPSCKKHSNHNKSCKRSPCVLYIHSIYSLIRWKYSSATGKDLGVMLEKAKLHVYLFTQLHCHRALAVDKNKGVLNCFILTYSRGIMGCADSSSTDHGKMFLQSPKLSSRYSAKGDTWTN